MVAGQVLARLDDQRQRIGVDGAAADVVEALAVELRARRSLTGVLDELRAEGVLPEVLPSGGLFEGDAGDAQLDLVRAAARARRKAAGLRLSRVMLAERTIRAPISGVVLSRGVDPGETIAVSPSSAPLFLIGSDPAELRLEVAVDERYVTSLRPDDARFTTPAFGRDELTASVREVLPLANPIRSPAEYTVVLSVPNREGRLHVGMSALVELSASSPADALALPEAAVEVGDPVGFTPYVSGARPKGQAASVWLSDEQGRPYKKAVEVGVLDADLVEIRNFDLQPGMVAVADRSPSTCLVRRPVSPYGSKEP